jgi:hypothetical protein
MVPYVTNRGGPLTGLEALSLQGIPVDDLILTRESEDQMADLAGMRLFFIFVFILVYFHFISILFPFYFHLFSFIFILFASGFICFIIIICFISVFIVFED